MSTVPAGSIRPARTSTIAVDGAEVVVSDRDRTRPFLLLHGGAGVASMSGSPTCWPKPPIPGSWCRPIPDSAAPREPTP